MVILFLERILVVESRWVTGTGQLGFGFGLFGDVQKGAAADKWLICKKKKKKDNLNGAHDKQAHTFKLWITHRSGTITCIETLLLWKLFKKIKKRLVHKITRCRYKIGVGPSLVLVVVARINNKSMQGGWLLAHQTVIYVEFESYIHLLLCKPDQPIPITKCDCVDIFCMLVL